MNTKIKKQAHGGLYLYETNADVEVSAGKAVVTDEEQVDAYAYSNGIYIFAGDVGIEAGKLNVSSLSLSRLPIKFI